MNVKFAICASAPVKPNWVTSPRFSNDEPSESLSGSPDIAPCTSWKQQSTVKCLTSTLVGWKAWLREWFPQGDASDDKHGKFETYDSKWPKSILKFTIIFSCATIDISAFLGGIFDLKESGFSNQIQE